MYTLAVMVALCMTMTTILAQNSLEMIQTGQTNLTQTNLIRAIDLSKMPWRSLITSNHYEGRFAEYFQSRVDRVAERQIHPFNAYWRLLAIPNQSHREERLGSMGKTIVQRSTEHAIRETLKDIPFIQLTINSDTFFARLFRNSIGNTAEEDFRAGQNVYTKNEEELWMNVADEHSARNTNRVTSWKRFTGNIEPRYGVRIDYAYAAFTVVQHHRSIVFVDLRYRYNDLISGDMGATAFEFLVSAPLGRDYFLSGGVTQRINDDWTRRFNIKITHRLPIDDGRIYLGLSLRQSENDPEKHRITSGLEFNW